MQTYIPVSIYSHANLYVYSHPSQRLSPTDQPVRIPITAPAFHFWSDRLCESPYTSWRLVFRTRITALLFGIRITLNLCCINDIKSIGDGRIVAIVCAGSG